MSYLKEKLFSLDKIQLLGVGFVVVWLIDFFTKWHWFGIESFQFLFFCSTMLLLAGIGFLFKKPKVVIAALSLTLVFQISWFIDINSIIFLGHPFNNDASYVYGLNLWQYIITLRHFFMIPVMLYGLTLFGPFDKKNVILGSVYTFLLGILASIILAPPSEDINYTGDLPHKIFWDTGDFFLNKSILLVFTIFAVMFSAFVLTKIPFNNPKWNKVIKYFSIIYIIFGCVLGYLGYLKLF